MKKNQKMNFSRFNRTVFLDSSKIDEIKKWNATGVIDGVTTNQMIMLKDGIKPSEYEKVIKTICREMKGKPVSIELTDSTASPEAMVKEAKRLNALADNLVVKVPLIPDTTKSLWVINQLAKLNIAVNITTMMTFEQMVMGILAARNCKRLSFVSIFWGRSIEDHKTYRSKPNFEEKYPKVGPESDVNKDVKVLVQEVARFLKEGQYENPKIIIGSLRNASQVGESIVAGGHIPTIPPAILEAMLFSQRSIETIAQFDEAWKELQKKK